MKAAKEEARNWLGRELASLQAGKKLQHRQAMKRAMDELKSEQIEQMELL